MVSILIPVYNYDVSQLVIELKKQLDLECIQFEIICIDDASKDFKCENAALGNLENVNIIFLKNNIGRSRIRNLLVEKSNFDWLLFLDSDVKPVDSLFIKNYLKIILSSHYKVLFGGIVNHRDKDYRGRELRWRYGIAREEVPSSERNKDPYKYFLGANFLIHKSIFKKSKFNDQIRTYGFEDFLFGENIKDQKITIHHIHNPVFHEGIDLSEKFLIKTNEALKNLFELNKKYPSKFSEVKLLKVYVSLKKLHLVLPVYASFILVKRLIERNLVGRSPSLYLFDFYKLGVYCGLK